MDTKILPYSFYDRDTIIVARELLGKIIVHYHQDQVLAGIIVETESYGYSDDPASHAYRGKTPRTQAMFGPVGHAYVYFIYGNHYCFNVVARSVDVPAGAVLIRAVEPVIGVECMQRNRNLAKIKSLTNGPGKLTQALGITQQHNALNLMQSSVLYITQGRDIDERDVFITPRIGISKAKENLWRFCLKNNQWVSR